MDGDAAGLTCTTEGSGNRVLEAGEVAGDYTGDWKGKNARLEHDEYRSFCRNYQISFWIHTSYLDCKCSNAYAISTVSSVCSGHRHPQSRTAASGCDYMSYSFLSPPLLPSCLMVYLWLYRGLPTGTFDMTLLVVTGVWLMMNVGLTFISKPDIFHNVEFWALQVNMVPSLQKRLVLPFLLIPGGHCLSHGVLGSMSPAARVSCGHENSHIKIDVEGCRLYSTIFPPSFLFVSCCVAFPG